MDHWLHCDDGMKKTRLLLAGLTVAALPSCMDAALDEPSQEPDGSEGTLAAAVDGLAAEYFGNSTLTGTPVRRTDPAIDFLWRGAAPVTGIGADNFSVRWTGTITPAYTERYTLRTLSDDGIRVWVDSKLVIDNWTPHAETSNSGTIELTAGTAHTLRVEYFERWGQATLQLFWSSARQAEQVVPRSALRPPGTPPPAKLELAAFPGASGAGALATGGRGGAVYVVTSLADAGPGTLRDCVERSGPRTCVFAVGGTIELATPLWISRPNLTVAGQTAPGGGIQITNAAGAVMSSLVGVAANDVVWRYTRLRNRYRAACSDGGASECGALFTVFSGQNVIADHNSLSWNQDEGFGIWRGGPVVLRGISLSHNLISEGLASHPTGLIVGGSTSALASGVGDVDIHHNVFMNNGHRNPLLKAGTTRLINNVFYNQHFYATQIGGGISVDVIGNAYRRGPMNSIFHEVQAFSAAGTDALDGNPSIHLAGNLGWNQPNPQGEQLLLTYRVTGENGDDLAAMPSQWRRGAALPTAGKAIAVESASSIVAATGAFLVGVGAGHALGCDGAWRTNRDSADTRMIQQLIANTGISRPLANEAEGGGLPVLPRGTACADADRDGMADAWELDHGLSPANANDRNLQRPGAAGFTNLELFLSGAFPVGQPLP